MFSGGDYEEVARWLWNFVLAHAKREDARAEVVLDTAEPREGKSYGVRLRLGRDLLPPVDQPSLEFEYADVAAQRGSLAWCSALAARIRALVREFPAVAHASGRPASAPVGETR